MKVTWELCVVCTQPKGVGFSCRQSAFSHRKIGIEHELHTSISNDRYCHSCELLKPIKLDKQDECVSVDALCVM